MTTRLKYIFLLVMIMGLVGCIGEGKGKLIRVDVQNYGEVVMITDNESIDVLRRAFEKVKWEQRIKPSMVRNADVKATLFYSYDKNMPERLYEYGVWFDEPAGTATIISNHEKEGYGKLDNINAGLLKSKLFNETTEWEARNKYEKNGKLLFTMFQDPELRLGKPYGYMFSFNEPFETFKGKELAIYAYHKETGERVTAQHPKKITEPSSGYATLSRFVIFFELPRKGVWKIEFLLDEQIYGTVILPVTD